jgi:hypothetical protein
MVVTNLVKIISILIPRVHLDIVFSRRGCATKKKQKQIQEMYVYLQD